MSAITVDLEQKIVTIYGVRYALECFEHLGLGPVGTWLRIVKREDGVVTVERKPGGEDPPSLHQPDLEDGGPGPHYDVVKGAPRSWPDGHD